MLVEINPWAILLCGVLSMVVGVIWYGPFFGKTWAKVIKATDMDKAKRAEMQKRAAPLYAVTFLLALFQAFVMDWYIVSLTSSSGVDHAIWLWAGFVIPTVAAGSMWNNDSKEISWARFGIQAGYYLVLFVIFGLVLGMWK